MSGPGIEGLAVGLNKGHAATQLPVKQRQNRHKGVASKKTKVRKMQLFKILTLILQIVRELVREITGFAPYERRVLEMLRISKDKRALKFLKRRIGTHRRAKAKREELQNVIIAQRKAHK
ncbi:CRE-RPL-36 protein [Caenorhabditis remanei]|uniref:60S ribosomal protein L36 n=1 Tax=Caenorhabditis remanei TaxID=31234 RepID=E3LSW8_CAERE|nr:CRE-RPL-36 protein [Caenorhabditis remanei]